METLVNSNLAHKYAENTLRLTTTVESGFEVTAWGKIGHFMKSLLFIDVLYKRADGLYRKCMVLLRICA